MQAIRTISKRGWRTIARWTVTGTLGCLTIALAFTLISFSGHEPVVLRRAVLNSTLVSLVLAAPLFFFLTLKLRELAAANHKLAALAATDSLTGCLNRGAFIAAVEGWMDAGGGRRANPAGALLVLDVDHFKAINDAYGHAGGDEALQLIAKAMRAASRSHDLIGQLGGEEFGLLLPGVTARTAGEVAERIRRTIAASQFAPNGAAHAITVSIGCSAFDTPTRFRDLFKIADQRLYRAKNAGRNRICCDADRRPAPTRLDPVLA